MWLFLVPGFASALVYQGYTLVSNYLDYSSVTTITTRSTSKFKFPAVTICPSSLFRRSKLPDKNFDAVQIENITDEPRDSTRVFLNKELLKTV